MDEDAPKCRSCGDELQGRDVYEGTCKKCREEAILGAPAKRKGAEPQPPRAGPDRAIPPDAIAIETSVDLDADTREIAVEPGAAEPAEPAPSPSADIALPPVELASDGASLDAPAPPPGAGAVAAAPDASPARAGLPAIELEAPPPAASGTGVGGTGVPPVSDTGWKPVPPATPVPSPRHRGSLSIAHKGPPRSAGEHAHQSQPLLSPHPEADASSPPPIARIVPRAPQPRVERPTPPRQEDREPFAFAPDEAHAPAPVPAQAPTEVAPEFTIPEEDARDRPGPERISPPEPEPGEPAPAPPPEPAALRLQTDTAAGKLRALLDEMEGQVEQLSKVFLAAHREMPSAFWFGFRAFFGFVLGVGVLAGVVLGLLAVIGLLFYPPAFELLRQLFGLLPKP
ncbi:MAG: hypothetical protein FJ291_25400 [Planctomycetes bacterium]|nr:hypothetical protein [Planctomycetota bacterium]